MSKAAVASKFALAVVLLASVMAIHPHQGSATAPPQFGTLSNFDVFNDTGQVTHGFEIELDGITSSDITYKFGAPYERYGDPQVVNISGGVDVLYESPYDAASHQFTAGTPLAPAVITPTGGHACWTGGSPTYPSAGCEHFGLGLAATPTTVSYHWLVADPKHAGSLIPLGGGVQLPAPAWNVAPAPNPVVNPAPVVAAVVQAPEPDLGQQLGNAVWVKVYVMESAKSANLNHLVTGDKAVPNKPTQIEAEWALLQNGNGGGLATELTDQAQMAKSSESVTRRYEFYTYTGPYDSGSHEALPQNDAAPSAGELGRLIGTQMGALNLAPHGAVPGDHSAPRLFVTAKPTTTTKATTAKIVFHATDTNDRTFTYYCALDRAIPAPCKSPRTLTRLALGVHTFKIYATDVAGNTSSATRVTWTITK